MLNLKGSQLWQRRQWEEGLEEDAEFFACLKGKG